MSIDLPTEPYNFEHVNQLILAADREAIIAYIGRYFFRTVRHHYHYEIDKGFQKYTKQEIKDQFFTNGHKISSFNMQTMKLEHWKLMDYYDVQFTKRYTIIYDPMEPLLTETTINLGNRYEIDTLVDSELTDDMEETIATYRNHIHTNLCSGDAAMSEYVMLWLAYSVMGIKLQTMLWFRGIMGVGKSICTTDFLPRIFGRELCVSVQEPSMFIGRFNGMIDGAKMLTIEELPTNKWDWALVEKSLRNIITSNYIKIEKKQIDGVNRRNTINIIMNSNEAVMKLTGQDRRIVMPQCSNVKASLQYYKNLKNILESDDAPLIMYKYFKGLVEANPGFLRSHIEIPGSESRSDAMRQGMTGVNQWIKYELLNRNDLDLTIMDLITRYKSWFQREKMEGRPQDKTAINQALAMLNLVPNPTTIGGKRGRYYKIRHEELYELFLSKNWLDDDEIDLYTNYSAPHTTEIDWST